MPIVLREAPTEASSAVMSSLTAGDLGVERYGADEKDEFSLSFPHRVATIRLDRIQPGKKLREIAEISQDYRFLVSRRRSASQDFVPLAAVTARYRKGVYRLGEVETGALVGGLETAVRDAEELDVVKAGEFEALLLLASALYTTALWLRNRESEGDLILQIAERVTTLRDFKSSDPTDFLNELVPLAEKMRTMRW